MRKRKLATRLFRVEVQEVHTQDYLVRANDEEDAINKVYDGKGQIDESHFEYSHTLDSNLWSAHEEEELQC